MTQGVTVAGLVLVAGGFALGLYPAGEGCGSPWSPEESTSCELAIVERQAPAWLLVVGGFAAVAGGLVAGPRDRRQAGPSDVPEGGWGVGEGPLVK
ncbi:hypothetical protein ACWC5I_00805 [Kitasatospora sp. NPDC001574]